MDPILSIEGRLAEEEGAPAIMARGDYNARVASRKQLYEDLALQNKKISGLIHRYKNLSHLPEEQHVLWAEELLALPTIAIVVLDSTGTRNDADILRLCVGDASGAITHDWLVQPVRQLGQANTTYTGIVSEAIIMAQPLEQQWDEIAAALKDRHLVAYNYAFIEKRLQENAVHYGLTPIPLIGEDVMIHTTAYFHSDANMKLVDACRRIGTILPSQCDAATRVKGIHSLLQAMASGMGTD